MQKLIKINELHYIVVDDSEILEGELVYRSLTHKDIYKIDSFGLHLYKRGSSGDGYQKITYSNQPLEEICCTPKGQIKRYIECKGCDKKQLGFNKVKLLSLSNIQEVINGYSVEKMAEKKFPNENPSNIQLTSDINLRRICYKSGINDYKELVKDKLFTAEELENAFIDGINNRYSEKRMTSKEYLQSKLPPTEWEVEITPEGKIILL